jgi:hypothetical protein
LSRFSALCFAAPVSAQGYGVPAGPKLGELEIKAYQKIPKIKIAVQLTSDTHLARELRRQVMVRLTQRGNQVGFSGGNVMRMDVSYFDLSGGMDREMPMMQAQDYETGANPRLMLPANPIGRRDSHPGGALRFDLARVAHALRIERRQGAVDGDRVLQCPVECGDAGRPVDP